MGTASTSAQTPRLRAEKVKWQHSAGIRTKHMCRCREMKCKGLVHRQRCDRPGRRTGLYSSTRDKQSRREKQKTLEGSTTNAEPKNSRQKWLKGGFHRRALKDPEIFSLCSTTSKHNCYISSNAFWPPANMIPAGLYRRSQKQCLQQSLKPTVQLDAGGVLIWGQRASADRQ